MVKKFNQFIKEKFIGKQNHYYDTLPMTQEDVDRQKREALYANDKPRISSVFEQPTNQYFF